MTASLPTVGLRCTRLAKATHTDPEGVETLGAVEISWGDGSVSVVDVGSDWVLRVSAERWVDPFEGAADSDPDWDLGRWSLDPVGAGDPLVHAVGAVLVGVRLIEEGPYGEHKAVEFDFGTAVLRCRAWGGDLYVELNEHPREGG